MNRYILQKKELYYFFNKYNHYFDIIYSHEGQPDQKFMYGRERYDVINEEIKLCGSYEEIMGFLGAKNTPESDQ